MRDAGFVRIALFVILAAAVIVLGIGLNQAAQSNPQLSIATNQPEPRWPDTIRGTLAPTPQVRVPRTPLPLDLKLPACAPLIEKPVALLPNFPPFPFPSGARYFKSVALNDNPNYILVAGYAPLNLDDATNFLRDELPKQGYVIEREDSEPGEAEGLFSGGEWRGGFRLTTAWDCDGVSSWNVVMIRK